MRLAFFHAPWCGVCHEKAPLVEQIAADVQVPLERWDIDTTEGARVAEARSVKTVPTLALLMGDRVPFRLVGRMITPETVYHLLRPYISTDEA